MRLAVVAATSVLLIALGGCGDDESAATSTTRMTVTVSACSELLPEGTMLRDDMFDLYCIGSTGNPETHTAEVRQCADGRSLYVSDLGWGYLDEPWHTAEPTDADLAACSE